jgi:TonB family protein
MRFALIILLLLVNTAAQTTNSVTLRVVSHRRIPETACELVEIGVLRFRDEKPILEISQPLSNAYASAFMEPFGFLEIAPQDLSGDDKEDLFYAARNAGFRIRTGHPASIQDLPSVQRVDTLLGPACPDAKQARQKLDAEPIPERVFSSSEPEVTPPQLTNNIDPNYPDKARRARIEGDVAVTFVVGSDGSVTHVCVSKSLDPGLDQEAVKTVKKWRFKPATRDNSPVAALVRTEVAFRLY